MKPTYRTLVAWQRADDLFIEIHRLTRSTFPKFEQYELAAQLRRAAYSVPANIAEGTSRARSLDSARFLNIASASLSELGYGLHAAARLGYLLPETADDLELRIRRTAAPLRGLIRRARAGKRFVGQPAT